MVGCNILTDRRTFLAAVPFGLLFGCNERPSDRLLFDAWMDPKSKNLLVAASDGLFSVSLNSNNQLNGVSIPVSGVPLKIRPVPSASNSCFVLLYDRTKQGTHSLRGQMPGDWILVQLDLDEHLSRVKTFSTVATGLIDFEVVQPDQLIALKCLEIAEEDCGLKFQVEIRPIRDSGNDGLRTVGPSFCGNSSTVRVTGDCVAIDRSTSLRRYSICKLRKTDSPNIEFPISFEQLELLSLLNRASFGFAISENGRYVGVFEVTSDRTAKCFVWDVKEKREVFSRFTQKGAFNCSRGSVHCVGAATFVFFVEPRVFHVFNAEEKKSNEVSIPGESIAELVLKIEQKTDWEIVVLARDRLKQAFVAKFVSIPN